MDDMEQKLNAILGNPEMMSQLMAMAQSLGQSQAAAPQAQESPPPPENITPPSIPVGMDLGLLQKVAGIASQAGVDGNQQALLKALRPYLSHERLEKLEKAMRAAKIAGIATNVLGSSGSILGLGR